MCKKWIAVLFTVTLGSFTFGGQVNTAESLLSSNVTRAVAQETSSFEQSPFAEYVQKIREIDSPSYETLRPLFENLTVYNADFAIAEKEGIWKQLAEMLSKPVWTGWNNYRPVGMLEIFDVYFPQHNADEEIALLEYNVKSNLLSKAQQEFIDVFSRMDDESVAAFKGPYEDLINKLETSTSYDPKEIVESFVPMIEAYNQLEREFSGAAFLAKKSVFVLPFAAGWGRTTTIEKLRTSLGVERLPGGELAEVYTPEQLQQRYGVSVGTAGVFFQFVKNYPQY